MAKNRRITILVAVALCLLLGVTIATWPAREPRYGGRKLTSWMADLDNWSVADTNAAVARAIRAMGPQCVPWVMRGLRAEDSWLKLKLLKLAAKQSIISVKFEPASKMRFRAIRAASALGPEARAVIPLLQAQFARNDFNAYSAAFALRSMGAEGLLPLMQTVTNGSREARLGAIVNLGIMRKNAAPAIPLLIAASRAADGEIRFCATSSLGLMGTEGAT